MAPRVDSTCLFPVWPPKVESVDELDQVLAELGRMERVQKRTAAWLEAKVATLTTAAAADLVVTFEGEASPLSFADWTVKLEEAAQKYADKHRSEILDDGRKSRKLNHGKFGWKESGELLEALEDFTDAGNPKILDGLLKLLRQSLLKLADFVTGGARFVEVKLSWRKKDLLKAYQDQDIGLPVLRKAGFEVQESVDEFYLKSEAGDVESLPGS